MLQRYLEINEYNQKHEIAGIENLLLTPTEHKSVEFMSKKLANFDSVTKALESENLTIQEVRVLFDSIIGTYPSTATRLASDAFVVLNPEFECSLMRNQSGKSSELTSADVNAVKCLKQTPTGKIDPVESVPVDDLSFAAWG